MVEPGAEIAQIAQIATSGERMVERLRKHAFLPDRRKALSSTIRHHRSRPTSGMLAKPDQTGGRRWTSDAFS